MRESKDCISQSINIFRQLLVDEDDCLLHMISKWAPLHFINNKMVRYHNCNPLRAPHTVHSTLQLQLRYIVYSIITLGLMRLWNPDLLATTIRQFFFKIEEDSTPILLPTVLPPPYRTHSSGYRSLHATCRSALTCGCNIDRSPTVIMANKSWNSWNYSS